MSTAKARPLSEMLPALVPAHRIRWADWLARAIALALLVAVIAELVSAGPEFRAMVLPAAPAFWAAMALLYLALPVADWIIFRRLWRLPFAGFPILLRKRISNEMLLAYSGEAWFYLWARRHAGLNAAPFGAIKDVAILSALAANFVTLALAFIALPFLNDLALGRYAVPTMISIGVMVALSLLTILFGRRLFTLPRRDLAWITGVHIMRLAVTTVALGAAWHVAMPAAPLGLWLVLATLRLIVSRLPLLPSKDLLFATIAIFLIGRDSEVATLMATSTTLIIAGHVLIGGLLGVAGLIERNAMTWRLAPILALPVLFCTAASSGSVHPGTMVVPPRAERGKAGAACRPGEHGPAARVAISGLKDREGMLRLELYPANDADFLAPDKDLIAAGKPFRRIEQAVPAGDPVMLCIRAPASGHYALTVLHDRDGDGKFGFLKDGVGFSNNPRLQRKKPAAETVAIAIGPGMATARIVMNYRRGLGFGPIER